MMQAAFVRLMAAACAAIALLLGTGAAAAGEETPPDAAKIRTPHQYVYIVYLNPADRECLPGYQERLDRVMTEVQQWYADEMKRNGFGPMTFPLERDKDGKLVIHVVKGTRAYAAEEEMGYEEIRDRQVKPALLKEGIDPDHEHIIIFQNLNFVTETDDGISVRCWAPYCGGGSIESGTAWVTDFELFDVENLSNKTMIVDLGFKKEWTLSQYVISHLGGVAHEFGHALRLPHNVETKAEHDDLGFALMGSGNYHLFGERLDEAGAHLSKAHATILSSHPLFTRNAAVLDVEGTCTFTEVEFSAAEGEYTINGRVDAEPSAYAVLAYNDPRARPMDYDATSWVSGVDEDGRFEVSVNELEPGAYELRLTCILTCGDSTGMTYQFDLDDTLTAPVETLNRQAVFELCARPAIDARDPDAMLLAIDKLKGVDDVHYRRAKAYYGVMTRKAAEPVALGAVDESVKSVSLSTVKWASADVGWDEPTRGSVPVRDEDDNRKDMPLESGVRFHENGLYAHADSRYVFDLDGRWKRFTSVYGLENLCQGSVVFIIKCDGEERFHSEMIEDWTERQVDVDLAGVEQLELVVTEGGNGKQGDCAIWFSPMLTR